MSGKPENHSITYRDSGVNIQAGYSLVEGIKPAIARTRRPEVLGNIGGFGGLFELPLDRYKKPVLVSGTDGVGTKLKLAIELGEHSTVGIDLVAMCVNDIVVTGAEPLFFLDYYATGRLDVAQGVEIISGIADGCEQAGAALIGGESAEMPGMYAGGDYDLAGFAVGIVERDEIIDGSSIEPGDCLIGLASSGIHSNGFSLVRKIIAASAASWDTAIETPIETATTAQHAGANAGKGQPGNNTRSLAECLLEPTRIYVRSILATQKQKPVFKALAHITGGGLPENLPRILPDNIEARITLSSWQRPAIFDWLQQQGNVDENEMLNVFNCGIGMVAVVAASDVSDTLELLNNHGETAWLIGDTAAASEAGVNLRFL